MYVKAFVATIAAICCFAIAQTAIAAMQSSHQGTVVSAGDGKLTMKGDDNQEHTHSIDGSVQITVHGQPGKLEDLKKGMKIQVTMNQDDKVTAVSTIDEHKRR